MNTKKSNKTTYSTDKQIGTDAIRIDQGSNEANFN